MNGTEIIRWDISSLSEEAWKKELEEALSDIDAETAIVNDSEQARSLMNQIKTGQLPSSEDVPDVGPQFSGPVDPELILIVLETTLIVIEGSKIYKPVKHHLKEKLNEQGMNVKAESNESVKK